jgi:hypothetical protein
MSAASSTDCDQMIRGDIVEEKLPSGATRILSKEFPALAREQLLAVAERVRQRLKD